MASSIRAWVGPACEQSCRGAASQGREGAPAGERARPRAPAVHPAAWELPVSSSVKWGQAERLSTSHGSRQAHRGGAARKASSALSLSGVGSGSD